MRKRFLTKPWLRLGLVLLLAGVLYSSWPLGYWLNPAGSRGLASNLEALNQPYNWLFIASDIVSGLLICLASWWLYRMIHGYARRTDRVWLMLVVVGVAAFGFLTALDAVLPLNCVSTVQKCAPPLQDPSFILHGVTSIGSVAGLTVSLFVLWWLAVRTTANIVVTRLMLHIFMAIWLGFGLATLVFLVHDRTSNFSQHIFIVFCSLWVVLVPFFLYQVLHGRRLAGEYVKTKR